MNPKNTKESEYVKLVEEIRKHDHAYYVEDHPVISDREYDELYKKLVQFESEHPELKTPDSPSQRVGGAPLKEFKKVKRQIKMMSLDNTYSEEQLLDFDERVRDGLKQTSVEYWIEPKIDGLGIECTYKEGVFVLGSTRGDGYTGEDVTENIKTIRSLPLKIKDKLFERNTFRIRGEVFIHRKDLEKINIQREKDEEPLFKNPRNAAAGSLRLLDSSISAKRPLKVIFYHWLEAADHFKTQSDAMAFLEKAGIPGHHQSHKAQNIQEVLAYVKRWKDQRLKLPYDVDGLVIKVNHFEKQTFLGETSKYPRWAIAYKYETEKAITTVLSIEVQVGRTGVLTPVAVLEPVELGGSTIQNASLHNIEEIERKDVRVGDTVVIEKAGEIIPQVVRVEKEHRTGKEKKFEFPKKCPVCGGDVGKKDETEVALRCLNEDCVGQKKEAIRYFCARPAMNIENIGPALVDQLVDQNIIASPADLYALDLKTLSNLERMADKSAQNVLDALELSKKNATLDRLIIALGIPHVGAVAAQTLAQWSKTLDHLLNLNEQSKEELNNIHGIGEKMADSVMEFFKNKKNKKMIQTLIENGVNPKFEVILGKLSGKKFCVTGSLKMPRDKIKEKIIQAGGIWSASVTKDTHYLIVGEDVGENKLKQAKKNNTQILTEAEFETML